MDIYRELGVRRVINAAATLTALGGSTMPREVLAAMNAAAQSHVDMRELHVKAGQVIAGLTRNEAAYVTGGCAAGISLAVLACAAGADPQRIARFPFGLDAPMHVVMHRVHRIPYDRAVELVGVRIREIGNVIQTFDWELDAAIDSGTCAVLWVAGNHLPPSAIPLDRVVEIAHSRGVPVIVDAAAQLPPVSNLWSFTQGSGADLVLFSGGKGLRGPQASGLMLGRPDLIEAARANGSPNQHLARAMKVGKEEIAGLLAAVQRYVARNHEDDEAHWRECVDGWSEALCGMAGVAAAPSFPNEAGQPVPRLMITLDTSICGFGAEQLASWLWQGDPRIAVLRGPGETIFVTPDTLADREEEPIVLERLSRALSGRCQGPGNDARYEARKQAAAYSAEAPSTEPCA